MKARQFMEIVDKITYKPGWRIDWNIRIDLPNVPISMYINYTTTDSRDAGIIRIGGGHMLDPDYFNSEEEVLRYVYDMLLESEKHEMGEWFRYKGELVYDPHRAAIRIQDKGVVKVDIEDE